MTGVGGSSNQWQTQQQAYLARRAGVHVIAVGAGRWLDRYELNNVVSQPRSLNAIFADSFSTLQRDASAAVRAIICNSMCHNPVHIIVVNTVLRFLRFYHVFNVFERFYYKKAKCNFKYFNDILHCLLKRKCSPYSIAERRVQELIPVLGSQPAVINPAVGCHYFPPGLQLPSRAATNFAAR